MIGTVNNCAGGMTPWGTYLTAEENFDNYFQGKLPEGHAEAANYKRYGVPGGEYAWGGYHDRFDWGRSRTSRTGLAGSSKSIRSIRRSLR